MSNPQLEAPIAELGSDVAQALLVEAVRAGTTKREALRHAQDELMRLSRYRNQDQLELEWTRLLAHGRIVPVGRRWEVRDRKPSLPPALGDGFPGTLRAVYCPAGTKPETVELQLTPGETAALFGHLVEACGWLNADPADYPDMRFMGIHTWLATTRPDLAARLEEGSLRLVLHLDKEGWPS